MKFDSMKKLADTRGMELFTLLDESFEDLYGTVPLTENQKRHYIKKYLPWSPPLYSGCSEQGGRDGGFHYHYAQPLRSL